MHVLSQFRLYWLGMVLVLDIFCESIIASDQYYKVGSEVSIINMSDDFQKYQYMYM